MFRVKRVLENHGKRLEALVVFGSSVYSPLRSRDLDILVVVDHLASAREKHALELEISRNLRGGLVRKPVDVVVLDVDALYENAKPGGLVTGLVAGYYAIYDEVGISELVWRIAREVLREGEYVVVKNGRRLNQHALARVKLTQYDYENKQ